MCNVFFSQEERGVGGHTPKNISGNILIIRKKKKKDLRVVSFLNDNKRNILINVIRKSGIIYIFTNPSTRGRYDTRSILGEV